MITITSTHLSVSSPSSLSRLPSRSGESSGDLSHAGRPRRLFFVLKLLPLSDLRLSPAPPSLGLPPDRLATTSCVGDLAIAVMRPALPKAAHMV